MATVFDPPVDAEKKVDEPRKGQDMGDLSPFTEGADTEEPEEDRKGVEEDLLEVRSIEGVGELVFVPGVLVSSSILVHGEGDEEEALDEKDPPEAHELRHLDGVAPARDEGGIDYREQQQHPRHVPTATADLVEEALAGGVVLPLLEAEVVGDVEGEATANMHLLVGLPSLDLVLDLFLESEEFPLLQLFVGFAALVLEEGV